MPTKKIGMNLRVLNHVYVGGSTVILILCSLFCMLCWSFRWSCLCFSHTVSLKKCPQAFCVMLYLEKTKTKLELFFFADTFCAGRPVTRHRRHYSTNSLSLSDRWWATWLFPVLRSLPPRPPDLIGIGRGMRRHRRCRRSPSAGILSVVNAPAPAPASKQE